jgi:mannose/fructose/N-acetylgalactosamine-specific phosphotransferase system component IIB
MPIVLYRVDERLIHGQVIVGWGGPLHADRLVVVDDKLAGSPWEQELYCLGVPPEMEALFVTIAETRRALADWCEAAWRVILLMPDVATLRQLAEGGLLRGERVNLGGIHHAAGRRRVLPSLFLNPDEERELVRLEKEEGVTLFAQDVPSSRSLTLDSLLGG